MTDHQRWAHLALLEEQAQTLLGWEPIKIASASQKDLELAIAQFRRAQEEETKHDHVPQQTQEKEEPVIVDLTHHYAHLPQTQNINQALLEQLIVAYCASSQKPVTAQTIEQVLFDKK